MRKKQYTDLLKNKLHKGEADEFIQWLNSKRGETEAMEMIEKDWQNEDVADSMNEVRLSDMLGRINDHTMPDQKPAQNKHWQFIRVAAMLLLGIGLTFIIFQQEPKTIHSISQGNVVKNNPVGQKSTIFLPDGTKVILNAESSITYPKQFDDNSRTVSLIGEAFFDVTKDEAKPFTVNSGSFSTTALGTSFNVRAYDFEDVQSVSLATGKVLVQDLKSKNGVGMFLIPGEHMSFSRNSNVMEKTVFDKKAMLGWKDGLIFFKEASLGEVVEKLSRWYGVKIKIQGKPQKDWTYQGEFKNQSLEYVLIGMGLTKDFEHIIDNKTVTLKFN